MNVKNNSRRRETIEKIENAFLEYLKTREISQIRVSDICKTAEINRSTFYASYSDIYDLAEKLKLRLTREVNTLIRQQLDWKDGKQDFSQLFQRIFEHIQENQLLYSFYFKLRYDDRGDLALYDIFKFGADMDEGYLDYHVIFFKNGFNAIIKQWLQNGCKETPEQMRDILLREYRGRYLGTV